MELTWIDDFIALDQTRNFTTAADQRCTTQSAFSRRIKTMEEWIGVKLFDRDDRPVTLTKAGEACKKRIYRLREDIIDMKRITNLSVSNLPQSAKTVYTTNTIAIGYLPQWIRNSKIDHYKLVVSSITQSLEAIRQGQADYALLPKPHHIKGTIFENTDILFMDELVFVKPQGASIEVRDNIIAGNILMYAPTTFFGEIIGKHLNDQGLRLKSAPVCESASAEALLAQVRNGMGCGWVVRSLLTETDNTMINHQFAPIPFDICLIQK
jgi:DNA-binding transcriptional LysR family regulator